MSNTLKTTALLAALTALLVLIGGFFGGRDHTTVLYANKLITARRTDDMIFRSSLEDIETTLRH